MTTVANKMFLLDYTSWIQDFNSGKKSFFSLLLISLKHLDISEKKIALKTKNVFSNCLALNFYMKEGKGTMFVGHISG